MAADARSPPTRLRSPTCFDRKNRSSTANCANTCKFPDWNFCSASSDFEVFLGSRGTLWPSRRLFRDCNFDNVRRSVDQNRSFSIVFPRKKFLTYTRGMKYCGRLNCFTVCNKTATFWGVRHTCIQASGSTVSANKSIDMYVDGRRVAMEAGMCRNKGSITLEGVLCGFRSHGPYAPAQAVSLINCHILVTQSTSRCYQCITSTPRSRRAAAWRLGRFLVL